MLKTLNNIKRLVVNSPMVKISVEYKGIIKNIYAQCGWYSLTGSIKDRVAYQIFEDAIRLNLINSNTKVCEATSGNMGLSICAISNLLGLETTIFLPQSMSEERKQLLKMYGAKLIETKDFDSAFKLCKEYEKMGYFCPHQFENISNVNAHYNITGKEILAKIVDRNVTNFVSGVGTGGTLTGVGKCLKEKLGIKVVGLEPNMSRILSKRKPYCHHKIQGLADKFLAPICDTSVVDNIIPIRDTDAIAMAQKLCKELSIGVGISSGANFLGGVLAKGDSVVVLPDDNKKYLSTDLSKDVNSVLVDNIKLISLSVI